MQAISQREAVDTIRAHDYRDGRGTVKVQFMTCHRAKKKGGEIITIENACGCGLPPYCKPYYMVGIKDMDTGKPYAVHVPLIFTVNQKEIYWV